MPSYFSATALERFIERLLMPDPEIIRIMLIDDHRITHEIVAGILLSADDIKLVAQGHNGEEAIRLYSEIHPDIVLMDVVMPDMDGIEATRILHERYPDIKILVLSNFQDDDSVSLMLRSGARGYILKNSLKEDLINTVRATFHGRMVFSSKVGATLLKIPKPDQDFNLTDREREILKLMAEGLNNYEIGNKLFITRSTVKYHLANILKKMEVKTRSEAIVLAVKHKLI